MTASESSPSKGQDSGEQLSVTGTFNPEHSRGDVSVTVEDYPTKPWGSRVCLKLRYPDGTLASLSLSPEQATLLSERLGELGE
jgi:hypothetical protein